MSKPRVFALGVTFGALAYPLGTVVAGLLFHRSVIYPH